jgi:hypothetical protein
MNELREFLEGSVEIFVLLQFGMLNVSCVGCERHHQDAGNCALHGNEKDVNTSVMYIKQTGKEYFNCPLSLVPQIIYDLWDEWQFAKEFNVSLTKDNVPNMLWWFIKTYTRVKNNIEIKAHEDRMKNIKKPNR